MLYARSANSSDAVIAEALRRVNEDYAHADLVLKSLAKSVNFSTRHLGRIFRNHTGQTFRQYLRHARMKKAVELLIDGAYDVKLVAALVGYSSRSHFDQDFRARFGCTPAQLTRTRRTAV